MTDITELSAEQCDFLIPYTVSPILKALRPFVTLTYAQSLDSMIALGPGLRTTLSGPESKSMTHWLRSQHHAILIGAGTAKADNPSLNCRYPGADSESQPRPIIVGSSLPEDWLAQCKATSLAQAGKALQPWRICADAATGNVSGWRWEGDVLKMSPASDGRMDWKLVLEALLDRGIRSVMVEGGASVINELLQRPDLVDSVIVTIAPTFLGKEGVQVAPPAIAVGGEPVNAVSLQEVAWCQFGQDMVLCGQLQS